MSSNDFTDHSRPGCCPPASGVSRRDQGVSQAQAVARSGPATSPPVVAGSDYPDVVSLPRLAATAVVTIAWIGFVVWVVVTA